MALLEVAVFQTLRGQEVVNRWNYRCESVPAVVTRSFALAGAMGFVPGFDPGTPNFYDQWRGSTAQELVFNEIQIKDLYSPTDFYVQPLTVSNTGDTAGETLPPFNAFGFKTSRVRTDIRRGYKRLAGVLEAQVASGGLLTAGVVSGLTTFAATMAATLSYDDEGNTLSFNPVILGLEKYTTPAGNPAYRPYATEAGQLEHIAQGFTWQVYPQVRSQVSRQYGRGR